MSRQSKIPPSFAALVQAYFTEYLVQQRALSSRTIAAYRDGFVLFLEFAESTLGKSPVEMVMTDITPELIIAFLNHLENQRNNAVRSRNARLAALRSFLKFAAHRDVTSLQVIERALGVPAKRFDYPMFNYLSREEILAVIGTPDENWISRRDHVMFLLMYNTGARVSEIIGITVSELVLDESTACVHLHGKGRKQRSVPLWHSTVKSVRAWLQINPQFKMNSSLLPNQHGQTMTRSNVNKRLALAVQRASSSFPELLARHISPHTIRHTTAMHLLQAGVDISVIALWLGHENPVTTHHYVEADLTMKESALAKLQEPTNKFQHYRAPDTLIAFLKML